MIVSKVLNVLFGSTFDALYNVLNVATWRQTNRVKQPTKVEQADMDPKYKEPYELFNAMVMDTRLYHCASVINNRSAHLLCARFS